MGNHDTTCCHRVNSAGVGEVGEGVGGTNPPPSPGWSQMVRLVTHGLEQISQSLSTSIFGQLDLLSKCLQGPYVARMDLKGKGV